MMPSVDYLGYHIDVQGLHPILEKVDAIKQAPSSQSVSELKSYSLTMPNSYLIYPLPCFLIQVAEERHSLEQGTPGGACSKELLTATKFLAHYSSLLPLTLACDASAYMG